MCRGEIRCHGGGIFIGYRREDSQHGVGRLVLRLKQGFPRNQVFMDVDVIEPALEFAKGDRRGGGS